MSSRVECPAHGSANLVEDHRAGDMVCGQCGLVVGDRVIDVGSEWRTFSNDKGGEDKSRVGGAENPLMNSHDLSTMIGSVSGNVDPSASVYHNRKTISSSDRTLMNAFKTISNMCDRHNLPRTISDRANSLFKMVHEGRNLKGRSNEAISAACLYIACRQEGVPRTFKEIVAVSSVSKKEIGRCFKLILKAHDTNVDIITTSDFMHRFCGMLGLNRVIQRAATHIAEASIQLDIVPGKSPISVAAAAIYLASQASPDKKSGKEIADVAGVAEATIRLSYKLMIVKAAELFPKDFVFDTPIEQLPIN